MNDNEKFCLMIMIMEDLRGDWSCNLKERVNKVRELAIELGHTKTIELCDDFTYDDGRHFRTSFELYGGYEGATYEVYGDSISKELLKAINENCNHPEYRIESLLNNSKDE